MKKKSPRPCLQSFLHLYIYQYIYTYICFTVPPPLLSNAEAAIPGFCPAALALTPQQACKDAKSHSTADKRLRVCAVCRAVTSMRLLTDMDFSQYYRVWHQICTAVLEELVCTAVCCESRPPRFA